MSRNNNYVYNKTHLIRVFNKRGIAEERNINISITDLGDCLQIKLRDANEFAFNYTENIDLNDFERIKSNQNLDINFNEFKLDLNEMLNQHQQKEMLLKCELKDHHCSLIFYGKSKIKSIIYLVLDLSETSQKEVFSEMNNNLQRLQDANERLKKEISKTSALVRDKEKEITILITEKNQIKFDYFNCIKQIESCFNNKLLDFKSLVVNAIMASNCKMMKLQDHVELLKIEYCQKSNFNAKLSESIENLKLESIKNANIIDRLKKENSALQTLKSNQERTILELTKNLQEKDSFNLELQRKNEELRHDLEKTSMIIAQQKDANSELGKDLLRANQMLVNFNNHYDQKVQDLEDALNARQASEAIILDLKNTLNNTVREFQEYRTYFNGDLEAHYKSELEKATVKLKEMEMSLRKANKLNTILTEKIRNMEGHSFI